MDDRRFRALAQACARWLVALSGAIGFSIYRDVGLFNSIGVDYALFAAGERMVVAGRPAEVFDHDAVARAVAPLEAYYRPDTGDLRASPLAYLPLLFLTYWPFASLNPVWGYLLWVSANLALAAVVLRGLAARFPSGTSWAVPVLGLCYFPLAYGLFVGQPVALLLFAFDRAYRAWENGRDFRSGLWLGALLLKPSYAPFLVLALAYKRRGGLSPGWRLRGRPSWRSRRPCSGRRGWPLTRGCSGSSRRASGGPTR